MAIRQKSYSIYAGIKKLTKTVIISVVGLSISRNVRREAAYFGVFADWHISGVFMTYQGEGRGGK